MRHLRIACQPDEQAIETGFPVSDFTRFYAGPVERSAQPLERMGTGSSHHDPVMAALEGTESGLRKDSGLVSIGQLTQLQYDFAMGAEGLGQKRARRPLR